MAIQFWRLQRLQATTQTPGAYLAPSVFVPVAVWRQVVYAAVRVSPLFPCANLLSCTTTGWFQACCRSFQVERVEQAGCSLQAAAPMDPAKPRGAVCISAVASKVPAPPATSHPHHPHPIATQLIAVTHTHRFQAVAVKFSRAVAAIHSAWHSAGLVDGSGAWDMAAVPHEGGSDDTGDDGGSSVSGSSSVGGDSEGPRGSPASSPSTSPQLGRGGGVVSDTTATVAASSVVSSAGKAAARFGSSVFSMVRACVCSAIRGRDSRPRAPLATR